ncbi:MAG: hypothetical protein D3910_17030 [Candidatus Electrothrix sp. ATG2]|nr:hypothetical protein [Candidatus Electrothrix sp. ATG2]
MRRRKNDQGKDKISPAWRAGINQHENWPMGWSALLIISILKEGDIMKKQKIFFCCTVVFFSTMLLSVSSFAEDEKGAEKKLVEKKCSICHSIDRVYGADKTHSEWKQTVEKMMRYSDQMNFLNQQEKETVIDYLANRKTPQADSEK